MLCLLAKGFGRFLSKSSRPETQRELNFLTLSFTTNLFENSFGWLNWLDDFSRQINKIFSGLKNLVLQGMCFANWIV